MLYRISKTFTFEAAHQLTTLPASHKCSRLHGHSYRVRITLAHPELTRDGFIRDYAELNFIKEAIAKGFDHRNLNEVLGNAIPPTAECLSKVFFDLAERVLGNFVEKAEVSETQNTWAEYGRH